MSPRNRKPKGNRRGGARSGPEQRSRTGRAAPGFGLNAIGDGRLELIHPRCVLDREEDFREGIEVWRGGEPEEAREVLRFALEDCGDNLWVHAALGQIALEMGDQVLARGHFGYAFELVRALVEPLSAGVLDPGLSGNRPFFDALDGLIACQRREGQGGPADALQSLRDRLASETTPPGQGVDS